MIEPIVLLILIGAVARFTRLVWHDDIATPLRDRIWAKWGTESFIGRLIGCPWCIAPWIAAPLTAITFAVSLLPNWAQLTWNGLLAVPAVSMGAAWITAATKEV